MEFGQAFSFVFKDQDWVKKVLIIALVSLIPIIGWLVLLGWGLEITRRVIIHDPNPLPELDFGGDLGRGFKAWVVALVYSLLLIIVSIVYSIITSAVANGNSSSAQTLALLLGCCFGLFSLVYGLALAFYIPAAFGKLADTGKMGDAFRLGDLFKLIRAAPVPYILVILGSLISGFIASLGAIACIIGVFVTSAYSVAINSHLIGQAYRVATGDPNQVPQ